MCPVFKHLTDESPASVEQSNIEAQKRSTSKATKETKTKEKEKDKDKPTSQAGSTSPNVYLCVF